MALRKCKECGQQISTKATSCPKCGAVLKKKTGCFTWLVAGFLIFGVIGLIESISNKNSNRDATEPVKKEKSAIWEFAKSFENRLAPGGRIWVTVTERAVVSLTFVDDMEKFSTNSMVGYAINIAKKHSDKPKDIAVVAVSNTGDTEILLNNPFASDFKAVWTGVQVDSEIVLGIFDKPSDLSIEIESFFSSTSLVPGTSKIYFTSFPRGTRSKVERLLWDEAFNQTWMKVFTKEELCQTR